MANKYRLERPSGREIQSSLFRVFGEKNGRQVWAKACEMSQILPRRVDLLSLDELKAVADNLERIGGLAKVVSCSVKIRINTFKSVERMGGNK